MIPKPKPKPNTNMPNPQKPSIKLMALLEPITAQGKEILLRPKVQTPQPNTIDWKNLPHAERSRLMNEARAKKKKLVDERKAYQKERLVKNNLQAVGLTIDRGLHERIQIQAKFDGISVQECYRSVITIGLLTIQAGAIAEGIATQKKGVSK